MSETKYPKPQKPTLYFIGVTTGKSSIMKVFPAWAKHLGLRDCDIQGIDFALHDEPHKYREAVAFVKSEPFARGALVTTHKLDLLKACRGQFDQLDEHALLTGEVSCIFKQGNRLVGHAKDVLTVGRSLDAFLPDHHWQKTAAHAFVLGAGGSAIALTLHLMNRQHGAERPSRILVTNRSPGRLVEMKAIHKAVGSDIPVEYHVVESASQSDELLRRLPPFSLVANATGLGKDAPGSPLSDSAVFPERGLAWDFNYRGDLKFLQQARSQEQQRQLVIEDGWTYFIHGWSSVVAEVFHIDIPAKGAIFDQLSRIAVNTRT
jgi:shikimate 5-dehydrogenase